MIKKTNIIRVVYINDQDGHFAKTYETEKTMDEVELLLKIGTCLDPEIVAMRKPGKISHLTLPV